MAKKRAARRGRGSDGEEEGADAASLASTNTTWSVSGGATHHVFEHDEWAEAVDAVYETRASTRERGWGQLVALMRGGLRYEDVARSAATLPARAAAALRRAGTGEAVAAATALSLLLVTLGEPNEELFQELAGPLIRSTREARGTPAQCAAADALVTACFVSAEDETSTMHTMQQLQALWHVDASRLRTTALRGWSLLYCCLSRPLDAASAVDVVAALSAILHEAQGDVDMRAAAGEALSLLHSSGSLSVITEDLNSSGSSDYDDDDDFAAAQGSDNDGRDDATDFCCKATSVDGSDTSKTSVANQASAGSGNAAAADSSGGAQDDGTTPHSTVLERVRQLAANKGDPLRRTRRDRAKMRSEFRRLQCMLEDGTAPLQRIKLRHGDVLVVDTLQGCVVLNWLRQSLAGGFQLHLQFNPLLHAVFGYHPLHAPPERRSAQEKRALRGGASKIRGAARRGARAAKDGAMRAYDGGEDAC